MGGKEKKEQYKEEAEGESVDIFNLFKEEFTECRQLSEETVS